MSSVAARLARILLCYETLILCFFRRLGRDLTWQFFKDKFVILNERYSSGFMLSRLVKSSTCDLLGEERAREVSAAIIIIIVKLESLVLKPK